MILTSDEFFLIKNFIKNKTGIDVCDTQKKQIENSIERRIDDLGLLSFKEYYLRMIAGLETSRLTSIVTVNETYFYRNLPQLGGFSQKVIPILLAEHTADLNPKIRVLSAGCSTGDEPYTLAILLKEALPSFWNIKIDAVDIDEEVLKQAVEGVYTSRAIRDVPPSILSKYFKRISKAEDSSEVVWKINDEIKSLVNFQQMNLLDGDFLKKFQSFDIIFCRNVLIYFEEYYQKKLVNYFYHMLVKGGFIFLGHSEMMGLISGSFKIEKMEQFISYRK